MFKINGLEGHIRANKRWSAAIVAGFGASVCLCWILCFIVYNTTYRYMVGEEVHRGTTASLPIVRLLSGGTSAAPEDGVFVHRSKTPAERARIAQQREDDRLAGKRPAAKPRDTYSLPELILMGITTGATTLYVPILFVAGWFVFFWFTNGTLVRQAVGAVALSRADEPRAYRIVENLSIQTGSPMPSLVLIESEAVNAIASGLTPDKAMIGVTRGLLKRLNQQELEAVLAHEYTHIRNGDSRLMVIATVFVGMFEQLFDYFKSGITADHKRRPDGSMPFDVRVAQLVAVPLALPLFGGLCLSFAACWIPSMIGRARLSRSREFLADAGAVELTKDADALVSALQRVADCEELLKVPSTMQTMMISGRADGPFATHPPVCERIAALKAYAGAIVRPKRAARPEIAPGQAAPAFGRRAARPARMPVRAAAQQ